MEQHMQSAEAAVALAVAADMFCPPLAMLLVADGSPTVEVRGLPVFVAYAALPDVDVVPLRVAFGDDPSAIKTRPWVWDWSGSTCRVMIEAPLRGSRCGCSWSPQADGPQEEPQPDRQPERWLLQPGMSEQW